MPRISLWNPVKGNDFNFTDRAVGESLRIGGDGILVHEYIGPTTDSDGGTDTSLTTIQDVLFLTNNNRKYNPDVIELRGHYTPQDVNYDLSQFGIFLSSDTIRVQFHYNDMVDALGRKLIAGDVLEFPNMRDTPIFDNAVGINRYYVVQDALYAAGGYGQKWFPHLWLVRAKMITGSVEYKEIIDQASTGQTSGGVGQGIGIMPDGFTETVDADGNPGTGCNPDIKNSLDLFCKIAGFNDAIIAEAEKNAFFDPKFFESANLYIYLDPNTGYPIIGSNYFSGDGAPPNLSTDNDENLVPSGPLVGAGVSFPAGMLEGQYYLRIDFLYPRLYQKQGKCFKLIEEDILKRWTAENSVLSSFINNNNMTILSDGTSTPEKQPISSVVKQRIDLYANRRKKVDENEKIRSDIANQRAEQENIDPKTGGANNGFINPNPPKSF